MKLIIILAFGGSRKFELQIMSRFMTRLAIKTDKYGLHVFGVDRQIRISEEIQLIKIYKSVSDA